MENQFGQVSRLRLTAAKKDGKTILEDVYFTAPFKVMRPFYEKKDVMTVMFLAASAGIMAGDTQDFEIHVKPEADMEFTSQSYEKIHKMESGHAERHAHIVVDSHAVLNYRPQPTIPFARSDFRSTVEVDLTDETSRFIFSEVLSCGRVAHGEEFQYCRYQNRISIRQAGTLIYRDNTRYLPSEMDMQGFGMYEGFTHLANLVICNEPKSEDWLIAARQLMDSTPRIQGGVTQLSSGATAVKILGPSGQVLTDVMEKLLALQA